MKNVYYLNDYGLCSTHPLTIAQGPNEEERGVVDDAQGTHPENTFKYDCGRSGHLSRLSITAIHVGLSMSRQARIF